MAELEDANRRLYDETAVCYTYMQQADPTSFFIISLGHMKAAGEVTDEEEMVMIRDYEAKMQSEQCASAVAASEAEAPAGSSVRIGTHT